MTTKVVRSFKYLVLFSLVFFSIISCEKQIESIGVNLVDNNNFSTNKDISEVIATTINVEKVQSNGLSQYLLGLIGDEEFGSLKASIVTQILPPALGDNYANSFGTNVAIDSVIVNIPYQITKEDNYSDGKPKFSIDSVFGDSSKEFQLSIYELKTFLNTLDPIDPSKNAVYYSDKVFQKGDTPLYSGNFKVNPDDTVSYVKRYLADGITVFDNDTIKESDVRPTIKLPLDEAMIKQLFIDNASGTEFSTAEAFSHYFRGLYIEASELTTDKAHLISLDMTKAKMTIYYSNDENEDADEDLNNNETTGEQGVRIKHRHNFLFSTLKSNVLERTDTNSKQSGADRLYVQGAAGSIATVDLFVDGQLEMLQNKDWLINEANLIFYVDQSAVTNLIPEQLFIYNYDDNEQIKDVLSEGINAVGGFLEKDADGNSYRYVFKITDYISELLKSAEPLENVKLGVKVFNPSDLPTNPVDKKIKGYNWNPKGVVLYNNNISAGDKRVKLEVSYTEMNK
jgi:hypothetical protein